jgi:hypothetical protein
LVHDRRWFVLVLTAALTTGCRSDEPVAPASGAVTPTVADATAPWTAAYSSLDAARAAFTRTSGTLTATLEDAAWIRLEGDPATARRRHRAYFESGYTTFDVVLLSEKFSQPTAEVFVLEDSTGARLTGRPLTYEGGMTPVGAEDRWPARFSLSFSHVLTADVAWLRLTRASDGSTVRWDFPGGVRPANAR